MSGLGAFERQANRCVRALVMLSVRPRAWAIGYPVRPHVRLLPVRPRARTFVNQESVFRWADITMNVLIFHELTCCG